MSYVDIVSMQIPFLYLESYVFNTMNEGRGGGGSGERDSSLR